MAWVAFVMCSMVEEERLPFREREWLAWQMLFPLRFLLHHLPPRLLQLQLCGQRDTALLAMLYFVRAIILCAEEISAVQMDLRARQQITALLVANLPRL